MEIIGWIILIAFFIWIFKLLFTTPVGWAILAIFLFFIIYHFKNKKEKSDKSIQDNNHENINNAISNGEFKKVNDNIDQQNDSTQQKNETSNDSEEYIVESDKDEISTDLPIKVTMVSQLVSNKKDENYEKTEDIYDKYYKIRKSEPKIEHFFGRKYDAPAYNDKYDTGTEFNLRELLLLVWYSRVKKGRMITTRIPQYFFNQYNINGNKLTQRFIDKGWLTDKDARYHLSIEGKQIADFYSDLWELHKISEFPVCLDEDFPRWHNGQLLKKFYKQEVKYLHAQINFYNKLIWFYKTYPKFFESKNDQQSSLEYTQQSIDNIENEIVRFNEKIKAF